MNFVLVIFSLALLAGCQSTRKFVHDHPVVSGIGGVLTAGSIAAAANQHSHKREHDVGIPSNPCVEAPQACR